MREALKSAIKNERYLTRTNPSEMGRDTTYDHFTELARKEFPNVPFIGKPSAQYLHMLTRHEESHDWSYSDKCQAVQAVAGKVDEMALIMRNERNTLYVHDYLDGQEILDYAEALVKDFLQKSNHNYYRKSEPGF